MNGYIIAGIIIGVVVLLAILVLGNYNSFVQLLNKVKEAFSTMDVYMKKRWDLIPNLVETVKGYAKHEKETLAEVVKLRNANYDSLSSDEKMKINDQMTASINRIMALVESYPELKANQNFMDLSNELTKIEEEIANSRKFYNATVRMYNDKVQMFPSNIVAKMFGFKSQTMFEISAAERENVKVQF